MLRFGKMFRGGQHVLIIRLSQPRISVDDQPRIIVTPSASCTSTSILSTSEYIIIALALVVELLQQCHTLVTPTDQTTIKRCVAKINPCPIVAQVEDQEA